MPRYDPAKVQEALQLVKDRTPHEEVVKRTGMGLSTLTRHIKAYREGDRPDVDVGVLPEPKSQPRKGAPKGNASLVRFQQGTLSAATHAEKMAADAGVMEEEAGRLESEAIRLREDAGKLREAAEMLGAKG